MTYNVFCGTLNFAQSQSQSVEVQKLLGESCMDYEVEDVCLSERWDKANEKEMADVDLRSPHLNTEDTVIDSL